MVSDAGTFSHSHVCVVQRERCITSLVSFHSTPSSRMLESPLLWLTQSTGHSYLNWCTSTSTKVGIGVRRVPTFQCPLLSRPDFIVHNRHDGCPGGIGHRDCLQKLGLARVLLSGWVRKLRLVWFVLELLVRRVLPLLSRRGIVLWESSSKHIRAASSRIRGPESTTISTWPRQRVVRQIVRKGWPVLRE